MLNNCIVVLLCSLFYLWLMHARFASHRKSIRENITWFLARTFSLQRSVPQSDLNRKAFSKAAKVVHIAKEGYHESNNLIFAQIFINCNNCQKRCPVTENCSYQDQFEDRLGHKNTLHALKEQAGGRINIAGLKNLGLMLLQIQEHWTHTIFFSY